MYSQLHLLLLETLVEAKIKRREYRPEVVTVKKINLLIQKIESTLKSNSNLDSQAIETGLDRLGQFLQGLSAAELVSGKTVEIITALKGIPANRLIQMYVLNLAQWK